jgi:multidrug efflux pump subunit AcrA (membrane-fusion protein)
VYLQARGALAGALASLERTLVRSPIAGTVTTLSVSRGDFVGQQQSIAVVAREGGQEVVAYASGDVQSSLAAGMQARIDARYDGIVTEAAPGLDPDTKRARVTIGLTGETDLVNGAFVDVAITTGSSTKAATTTRAGWYIPITAIKVLPDGLAVFTVGQDGVLVAHPIEEGTILGDRMIVREGITSDMAIVTDVRGRRDGERVDIAE